MKLRLIQDGETIEETFRVSSISREFDGPQKGGVIVRLFSEKLKKPLQLDLTLEANEALGICAGLNK